jgi:MFS-type transporter involved in bile tolerance (Atg22 family)
VHRPRGAGAVLTAPQRPLPQSWVPRVLNVAIAVLFLALLAPVFGAWSGKPGYVQAAIVLFGTPFLLVALLCLSSAARPGSVGRAARRLRRR